MNRSLNLFLKFLLSILVFAFFYQPGLGQTGKEAVLKVKKTTDFSLDGKGTAKNWSKTEWFPVSPISTSEDTPTGLTTKTKILYSDTGIYILFQCEDHILTATMDADFMKLWEEDVVEAFLWPDETTPVYFEYELSPLNYELPLLISNKEENFHSWRPFSYDGDKRTRHKTSVIGGKKDSGASVRQWSAEFFIPYKLLDPLNNITPEPGTKWRANFYRIDYDEGQTLLAWQPVQQSFHEYKKFGTLLFE